MGLCGSCVDVELNDIDAHQLRQIAQTGDLLLKATSIGDTLGRRDIPQMGSKLVNGLTNLGNRYQISHACLILRDPPRDLVEMYRCGRRFGTHFRVSDAGRDERVFLFESSRGLFGTCIRPLCDALCDFLLHKGEEDVRIVIRRLNADAWLKRRDAPSDPPDHKINYDGLWNWLREVHGREYGLTNEEIRHLVFRTALKPGRSKYHDLDKLFCSEAVAEGLTRLNLVPAIDQPDGISASQVRPIDLAHGKLIDHKLLNGNRYGPHLRLVGLNEMLRWTEQTYPRRARSPEEAVLFMLADVAALKTSIAGIEHRVAKHKPVERDRDMSRVRHSVSGGEGEGGDGEGGEKADAGEEEKPVEEPAQP